MEADKLPRAVELAVNIMACHVRKTKTNPEDMPSLLAGIYGGIKSIEKTEADPEALIAEAVRSVEARRAKAPEERLSGDSGRPREDIQAAVFDGAAKAAAAVHRPVDASADVDEDRRTGYVRDGRRTVTDRKILCLEDGREVTFLGRHLRSIGVSEADYRRKWSLPDDYPSTAQAYVDDKKQLAKTTGFGQRIRPTSERAAEAGPERSANDDVPRERRRGTLGLALA